MMNRFEHDHSALMGMPRHSPLWRRSYQVHRVRGEQDFVNRLDYIHYNPVYHRLAERPEEWPYSSYETWVARGAYQLGWGWALPENLNDKRWG
jgi:putative transposase